MAKPGPALIEGTNHDDTIVGSDGDDTIDARGGDDFVCGGPGDDDIAGGKGDDAIRGDTGDDSLDGGPGNDTVVGDGGSDDVSGGEGRDYLLGGSDDDLMVSVDDNDADKVNAGEEWTTASSALATRSTTASTEQAGGSDRLGLHTAVGRGRPSSLGRTAPFSFRVRGRRRPRWVGRGGGPRGIRRRAGRRS